MSQARLASCVPLPLENKVLVNVIEKAKDWALMHGVGMRDRKHFNKDVIQIAPFVLLPSPFPRTEFMKAVELQPVLNELMHKVAHDDQFLEQTLQNALQVDEFTKNLYDIWVKVRNEGITQPISLGMLRSDIMLESRCPHTENKCGKHTPYCSWKQVEINSIASGFGHLGPVSREIQSYILRSMGYGDIIKNMPENRALSGLCAGIIEAYDLFGVPDSLVLFVVEEVSYNICDQRFHEFHITEARPDIMVIRKTLCEIYEETELNDKKQLLLEGKPVAVVYYRSGYEPAQYPSSREWDARLRVERSSAIKCPSIHYQLAGTKKVQQALAIPGALEKFMGAGASSGRVRDIFTGLYSLDFDEAGERALEMAIADAERFVLKPQREGGGNNLYGEDVREALLRMRHSRERAAYILMERILPPLVSGYVVRPGAPVPPPLTDLVSELGIFGVIIGTKDKIYSNRQVGHMLRTKLADANEGGVAAGLGALDSPYLLDM
ncbi:glutathione synthetase isoform X1 [Amyelois transitella]|uniref:glutathione synthetase isoform X1 n=1 Tax=Amyelois transitella TaxID=680683 RepID=UPI00067CF62A|nr:glutathione synthetase isoform X1 [Amyelois transitella]XP_060807243.1 glutathione synthetase isoform X1 [Amyelois transitella]